MARKTTLGDVISALEDALEAAEALEDDDGLDSANEAAGRAIAELQRGDTAAAITTLEREFFPKWRSVGDCLFDFKGAKA